MREKYRCSARHERLFKLAKDRASISKQKAGRFYPQCGDFNPAFVHEVKDDVVILKWILTIRTTPRTELQPKRGGLGQLPKYEEEYIVTIIKGTPTNGIDFDKRREARNGSKQ